MPAFLPPTTFTARRTLAPAQRTPLRNVPAPVQGRLKNPRASLTLVSHGPGRDGGPPPSRESDIQPIVAVPYHSYKTSKSNLSPTVSCRVLVNWFCQGQSG